MYMHKIADFLKNMHVKCELMMERRMTLFDLSSECKLWTLMYDVLYMYFILIIVSVFSL